MAGTPDRERSLATIRDRFLDLVSQMILLHERVAREEGLTAVELQALHLLALAGGALSPSELSERAELARSTTTRVIARLEERGYVVREEVASDGRRALIRVVPAAIAGVSARFDAYARAMDRAGRGFGDAELATIAAYWEAFQGGVAGRE